MGGNFTPELKRLLRDAGCRFERAGKGDHEIWFSPNTGMRFPVDHKNQVAPHGKRRFETGRPAQTFLNMETAWKPWSVPGFRMPVSECRASP